MLEIQCQVIKVQYLVLYLHLFQQYKNALGLGGILPIQQFAYFLCVTIYLRRIQKRSKQQVVLAAVSKNGYALEYASEELKRDRNIVLAAISKDGRALEYASEELKKDREILTISKFTI